MNTQQTLEQVAGILHRADLQFDTRNDGLGYRVPFGTAAVFVEVEQWGDGTMVSVTSPVLQAIDEEGAGGAAALNRLNPLNSGHRFLKFVLSGGDLVVAADLLGDTLQSADLLNAVYAAAAASDRLGPELARELGGLTYEEWLEEQADRDTVEADDDIPF